MNFSEQVKAFAIKTNSKLDQACRTIKVSLFSGIVRDTRVDTGRLRGNWQTSTGSPKYGEIDRFDKTGNEVTKEIIDNVSAFGVDYMTNNLPYAKVWEDKDHMVQKNIARVTKNIKEVIKND